MSFLDKVFGGGYAADDVDDKTKQPAQNTNKPDDNTPNNVDDNKSYWDNKDNQPQPPETQKVEIVQQPEEKSAQEQMQEHLKSLNLTNGIDMNKVGEDLRNGDSTALDTALSTVAGNAYSAAMQQTNALIEAKLEGITAQATEQANATMNSNLAVAQMQQKLGFTKDPDIEPIAKAALAQAIKSGKSQDEAIASVAAFFMKAANNIQGAMKPPTNSSGNPQFPQDRNNNSGKTNHDEWLDVLTGKTN